MIRIDNFQPDKEYFAAANSHNGFISKFDSLFRRDKFEKVFILKGGPGTGKSTMLKGLCSFGHEQRYWTEAIYCSSDPYSLDGVIISKDDRRIAVLDGTAPHTEEALFPGCSDELLDLGAGFDTKALENMKTDIIELNQYKKAAYKNAYTALEGAGRILGIIRREIVYSEAYFLADKIANDFVDDFCDSPGDIKNAEIYFSSFGKAGIFSLPVKTEKKHIGIIGDTLVSHLVLAKIYDKFKDKKIKSTAYFSALDNRIPDRIETDNFLISASESTFISIDASGIDTATSPPFHQLVESYFGILDIAKSYFKKASSYHFSLEDIYKSAVDFSYNDMIFSTLINRIPRYLL